MVATTHPRWFVNPPKGCVRLVARCSGLAIALMALAPAGCSSVILSLMHNHPSDKNLIAHFGKHRSDFDTLRQMLDDDPELIRVNSNYYDDSSQRGSHKPSAVLSRKRWAAYRDFFRKLQLENGIWQAQSGKYGRMVFFFVSTGGALDSTSAKGIAYISEPPTKRIAYISKPPPVSSDSLDNSFERSLLYGYKHIEGNWYVFFSYNSQR